jgi:hypothetical protein
VLATVSQVLIVLGFHYLPGCEWLRTVADWYLGFA